MDDCKYLSDSSNPKLEPSRWGWFCCLYIQVFIHLYIHVRQSCLNRTHQILIAEIIDHILRFSYNRQNQVRPVFCVPVYLVKRGPGTVQMWMIVNLYLRVPGRLHTLYLQLDTMTRLKDIDNITQADGIFVTLPDITFYSLTNRVLIGKRMSPVMYTISHV